MMILCLAPIAAQNDTTEEEEQDIQVFNADMIQEGDQNIRISLAPSFPLNFPDFPSLFMKDRHQLSIGGIGSLGYHYFLNSLFAVGVDIGFGFNVTIGSRVLNYVPFLASFTFQPTAGKFEFPISMNVGFAWESYSNYNYFPGLILKPEAGVHYRLTSGWSLGLEVAYMFMPQLNKLYDSSRENFYGQFLTTSIVARYYF